MSKLNTYISGISNEDYHGDKDFISRSQLKKAISSHGTFRYEMNKPYEEKKWDKNDAMALGSLTHCLLLEPEVLEKEFAFIDIEGRNFRTKADKEYLAKALDHNKGKIVLTNCRKKVGQIMAEKALEHPFFKRLLEAPGEAELSGYFKDDFYNTQLRFRPDRKIFDIDGSPAILDVKTTFNMDTFSKSAKYDFHYDLSAYQYLQGNEAVTGEKNIPFYFGVIESVAPYRVAVYKASDRFLEQGKRKYIQALSNVSLVKSRKVSTVTYQEIDFEEI